MAWENAQSNMKPFSFKIVEGKTTAEGTEIDPKELERREKKEWAFHRRVAELEREWAFADAKARFEAKQKAEEQIVESEAVLAQARIDTMADGIQKELALLDMKYQKMREGYAGNAIALANIDKAYDIEKRKIIENNTKKQTEASKKFLQSTTHTLHNAASQWKEFADVYQAVAYAQTIWDTYSGAQAAYKSMAGISPILGALAASTAILAGLARAAEIKRTKFATGIQNYRTSGPQTIVVGDNPGGVEDVSVRPISSQNINGPAGSDMKPINIYLNDHTGGLIEKLRGYIRSNEADRLVRDILARGTSI